MTEASLSRGYRFGRWAFHNVFSPFATIDVKGLDRIPLEGPTIVAGNHMSYIEGLLIFGLSPRHPMTALAKEEFKGTLAGRVVDLVEPIYIARGEVDRKAIRELMQRLKSGGAVGIAPEGTRSKTGQLLEGKEGAAYLALQTGASLVPVAVWGQEKMVAELKRLRRPTIYVRVGQPFKLENEPGKPRSEILAEGTKRLMHAIARMLPPEYRGFYANEVQGAAQWS